MGDLDRRTFVTGSVAVAVTAAAASEARAAATPGAGRREFYAMRQYRFLMGAQQKAMDAFVGDALVPALNRMGVATVGVFSLEVGPETPTMYVLLPATDVEVLLSVDARLADDAEFQKAGAAVWRAPAAQPMFTRVEGSLLRAFAGWPTLRVGNAKEPRVFQLRTYESPTYAAHVRKVEMFESGEFAIFEKTGLHPVFFSETLVGPRMPSLTYMLRFADQAELTANWAKFSADPDWKKLSTDARYAEPIVSNITNLVLRPAASSQI